MLTLDDWVTYLKSTVKPALGPAERVTSVRQASGGRPLKGRAAAEGELTCPGQHLASAGCVPDGRPRIQVAGIPVVKTFTDYEAAVAWRNKQTELALRGRRSPVNSQRMTFAEHWERWRAVWFAMTTLWLSTTRSIATHLAPAWGRTQVAISRAGRAGWIGPHRLPGRAGQGLSASLIRRCATVASVCVQALVDDEVLDRNPFRRLDLPDLPDEEAKFVAVDEAVAIEAATDLWWRLTIPLLLDTGLRIGELAGLRVCDVVMRGRTWTVNVRQIVTETSGYLKVGPPKTRSGVREVPTVTEEVAERLAGHIAERGLSGADHLFMGERGGIMRPNNWRSRAFAEALERSAIEEAELITPHSFRHGAVAYGSTRASRMSTSWLAGSVMRSRAPSTRCTGT